MSKEEYKKMWDNMIEKLNETERHYLAIVNNQKNQEIDRLNNLNKQLGKENKRLNNIISEIERLIINHNCDTGDIYYKYNGKYLKSELKERIGE